MSFQQGLSGLAAAARNLDAIGNNVANANTVGFKSSGLVFADIYANSLGASLSTTVGIGTAVAAVQANFGQGNLRSTSNPLDVAINGSGFFRLDTNGAVSYSRNGQFHLDKDDSSSTRPARRSPATVPTRPVSSCARSTSARRSPASGRSHGTDSTAPARRWLTATTR